jgi:hypothetical protein
MEVQEEGQGCTRHGGATVLILGMHVLQPDTLRAWQVVAVVSSFFSPMCLTSGCRGSFFMVLI